jgi:hypothetical protein
LAGAHTSGGVTEKYGWKVFRVTVWTGKLSIRLMVPETVHCFVVLFFTERFPGGSFDGLISLLLSLCENLGISIMIVVLLLCGGGWFELWSKGVVQLQMCGIFGKLSILAVV